MIAEPFAGAAGPLVRAAPVVRLGFGAGLLAAGLAAPVGHPAGPGYTLLLALLMLAAARPPRATLGRMLALGAALYLPLLGLLVAAAVLSGQAPGAALPHAAAVTAKGFAALLIGLGTVSTLRAAEMRDAFAALPLPATARLLLVQVTHQTGTLLDETRRMRQVLAVRGATRGRGAGLRVAIALPQVWLGRLARRAGRVADAMEVRGYDESALLLGRGAGGGSGAVGWLGAAALALLLAAGLHAL